MGASALIAVMLSTPMARKAFSDAHKEDVKHLISVTVAMPPTADIRLRRNISVAMGGSGAPSPAHSVWTRKASVPRQHQEKRCENDFEV